MNAEIKIEYYLSQLDRSLQALPVGQRAEIITEIKSHIQMSMERTPLKSIDDILNELGSPQVVAERYLRDKGLSVTPIPRRGRWLKWLAIGTVAGFACVFAAGLAVIWYLSPIVKIDEPNGRVVLFGGLIDVNEKLGHVKFGNLEINDALKEESMTVEGDEDLAHHNVKLIKIPFNTARLEIVTSLTNSVHWKCKSVGGSAPKPTLEAGVLNFSLDSLNLAKCTIALPFGMASEFRGVNGHMDVQQPSEDMRISLVNGKVNLKLDPARVYDVDVKVRNGLTDFFPRSSEKKAVKVQVDVVNGLVKKE